MQFQSDHVVRTILALFTLLYVFMTAGSFVAPACFVSEVAASCRILLFAAGAVFWIVFTLSRRRMLALLSLAACVANGTGSILALRWLAHADALQLGPRVRVITLNVFSPNREFDAVIALARKEHPDLLILQEATSEWQEKMNALADILPYAGQSVEKTDGVLLRSRTPITAFPLTRPVSNRLQTYEVEVAHGEKLSFIGLHFSPLLSPETFRQRNEQLRALAFALRNVRGPLIIGGDFNTSSSSPYLAELLGSSGLRNASDGFGILRTWRRPAFPFSLVFSAIDHVLVSGDWQVENVRVGADIGSDHLPVIADLVMSKFEATTAQEKI